MDLQLAAFVAGVAVGAAGVAVPVLTHVHSLKDRLSERIAQLENGRVRGLEDAVRELQPILESVHAKSVRASPKRFRGTKKTGGRRA